MGVEILQSHPSRGLCPLMQVEQLYIAFEICQQEMPLGSITIFSLEGLWEERKGSRMERNNLTLGTKSSLFSSSIKFLK